MPRPAHLAKEVEQNTSEDPFTKVKGMHAVPSVCMPAARLPQRLARLDMR